MQISGAREFIIDKLKNELPPHLSYHNVRHTLDVYDACERIGTAENINGADLTLLLTAALFHDSGFVVKPEGHELISCEIARENLPRFDYSPKQIDTVCTIIMATKLPQQPKNHIEQVISDADLDYLGREDFFSISNSLYAELFSMGLVKNVDEWNHQQVKFLGAHHYFTNTARQTRDKKKQENLAAIKNELKKNRKRHIHHVPHTIQDIIYTVAGILVMGFALKGFMVPNKFLDGGVTGISLLAQELFNINLSYTLVLANIPLIIMGYYIIGHKFAIKTFCAVVGVALCLRYVPYPVITSNLLLVSIFGGFFIGIGVGLAMRGGCALDGIEVLALYTLKRTSFSISEIILGLNVIIFLIAALHFGLPTAFYSMLTYYTASRTINYIIEGIEEYNGVTIISGKSEEIKRQLVMELKRGITVYKGERGFLKDSFEKSQECDIVFTVVTRFEVRRLKNMVYDVDPKAFVFTNTIKEASGGVLKQRAKH